MNGFPQLNESTKKVRENIQNYLASFSVGISVQNVRVSWKENRKKSLIPEKCLKRGWTSDFLRYGDSNAKQQERRRQQQQ